MHRAHRTNPDALENDQKLFTKLAFWGTREEARFVSIVGRQIETKQEDRRNRNEKEADNEAEVCGFHNLK